MVLPGRADDSVRRQRVQGSWWAPASRVMVVAPRVRGADAGVTSCVHRHGRESRLSIRRLPNRTGFQNRRSSQSLLTKKSHCHAPPICCGWQEDIMPHISRPSRRSLNSLFGPYADVGFPLNRCVGPTTDRTLTGRWFSDSHLQYLQPTQSRKEPVSARGEVARPRVFPTNDIARAPGAVQR